MEPCETAVTPYAVSSYVPPKISELEARLRQAGFRRQASRGSHRKWIHPSGRFVVISGAGGSDAKKYQEAQVAEAIAAAGRPQS
jgi:predicted RNA binding protein YcfA (HicA-like mRNA interferase family)